MLCLISVTKFTGSVFQLMVNRQTSSSFSETEVLKMFCDMCDAVSRLHHCQTPIIHRDLKVGYVIIPRSFPATWEYQLNNFIFHLMLLPRLKICWSATLVIIFSAISEVLLLRFLILLLTALLPLKKKSRSKTKLHFWNRCSVHCYYQLQ